MESSVILISFIILGLAVFGAIVFRNIMNPITVFCGLWGVLLFWYGLHLYGLYEASAKSLSLVITGIGMFFVGAMAVALIYLRVPKANIKTPIRKDAVFPRYNTLLFLNVITFFFLIGFGVTTLRALFSGSSFYLIHKQYNQAIGTIGSSRIYQNIITWFVWPLLDASMASAAVILYCDKSRGGLKTITILLILVNLALFTLITGKRSHLGYMVMYVIAVRLMQGRTVKLKKYIKVIIAAGFIAAFCGMAIISFSRGVKSIFRTLYVYMVGCFPHLSIKLEDLSVAPKGPTSIYGFYQAPLLLFNSVFRTSFLSGIRSSMSEVIRYTQVRVSIAPDITYNAFLTPFFYFYLDGGIIGNIILSFIFGAASTLVYLNHLKKRNFNSLVIYLLIFFTLYMSMVRIQFFQMRFALSFFYIFLCFRKTSIRFTFGSNYRYDTEQVSVR